MADNQIILKTRLLNKYNSSVDLMKGEINFIPATMKDGSDDLVIMQVGADNGTVKEFAAKASDVYSWAKASTKPEYVASDFPWLADFISGKIQDTNTTYTFDLNDEGELVVKSKEVNSEALTTVATIDFVTPNELTSILSGYVTTSALNSKLEGYVTTSDYSADLVVLNSDIAAAKKAGTDAAAALNTYKSANDAALAGVKATAEAAPTVGEVDEQIDAKINALNLDTRFDSDYDVKGAAATAETNAKAYADGLADNYDVAGAATTAEQNAKSYADGLAGNYDTKGSAAAAEQNAKNYADSLADNYDVAGAAAAAEQSAKDYVDEIKTDLLGEGTINATYDTLKEISDWIVTTGVDATELSSAIAQEVQDRTAADNALSARIKAYEDVKNTYATTSALEAVSKVADAAQTEKEVSDAIDAKITALNLDTRFDNDYDAKGAAAAAQTAATNAAATDATTKANKALADAKAYADANDADTTYNAGAGLILDPNTNTFSIADSTSGITFILDGNT